MSDCKCWAVIEQLDHEDRTTEFHIVPENDHIIHEIPGDECPCGPASDIERGIPIYRHHSLDGREKSE